MMLRSGISWGEYWAIVLDGMEVTHFLAYGSLMVAGAMIYFILDVKQSMEKDDFTPRKFDFWFMVKDNVFRFIGVALVISAATIFFESFYGVPINAKLAFTSGLSIDALIGTVLKQRKLLLRMDRRRENNGP